MLTVKQKDDHKLEIDFSSTMFFQEMLACPSSLRDEFIHHIEEQDSEWLFKFCVDNLGSKVFTVK